MSLLLAAAAFLDVVRDELGALVDALFEVLAEAAEEAVSIFEVLRESIEWTGRLYTGFPDNELLPDYRLNCSVWSTLVVRVFVARSVLGQPATSNWRWLHSSCETNGTARW